MAHSTFAAEPEVSPLDLDADLDVIAQSWPSPVGVPIAERKPILYLNHSARMSGAEASLRTLLWAMRRAASNYEPIIALPDGGPFLELLRDEGWNVTLAPLRRLQRPRGIIEGMSSILHVLQTAPHICRLVNQTQARIVHSNSTTAHLVGGLAAERTGRPAIWHCRDLVTFSRLAPQLANKATRIIAISGCVADLLEKEGVPHEKIAIVHNGLDPDEWQVEERSPLRESLALPAGTFLFGVVGQLVPWKNHRAFIEAAAQIIQDEGCSHARFAIIGGDLWGDQTPYVKSLRDLISQHNLSDYFSFVPHVSNGAEALRAIDALVHPSHQEPFGRVIMEAMALRKPVIAMNENGPREIISHEHDGLLVAPQEHDGIAHAMKRLLTDPVLVRHLSHHSRPSIENRFHSDDHATKIAEIYRELGA